jgi:tight adherence protein B
MIGQSAGSPAAAALLLAGLGLVLWPPAGLGHRLTWLAGHRWPRASSAEWQPDGRVRRLWSWVSRRPVVLVPGVTVAAALVAGPVPGLLAGLSGLVLGRCWRRIAHERRLASEAAALSEAVAAILAEHAAGATLGAALSRAAPSAGRHQPALHQAGRLASLGQQPAGALAGEPALARIAVATALVGRSGVSVDQVLDGVRDDLRSELRMRAAVAEAVAGARSSAMLLTALPAAGLAMGVALGAHPQRVLLHTGPGLAALTAGVVLNLTGLCWVIRLTGIGQVAASRAGPPSSSAARARASPLPGR